MPVCADAGCALRPREPCVSVCLCICAVIISAHVCVCVWVLFIVPLHLALNLYRLSHLFTVKANSSIHYTSPQEFENVLTSKAYNILNVLRFLK